MADNYPERSFTIGAGPTKQPRIGSDPGAMAKILARLKGLDPLIHPLQHLTMRESATRPEAHIGADPMAPPQAPSAPAGFGAPADIGDLNVPNASQFVVNDDPSPIQTYTTTEKWNWPKMLQRPVTNAPYDTASLPGAPKAPSTFSITPELGAPNIPDTSIGDVANDDPNMGVRLGWSVPGDGKLTGVLEGLRAAGGESDPTRKLYLLQDKLRDEIAGNLSKAQGAGPAFASGADRVKDLIPLERDLAASPVTQYQNQKIDQAQREYEARMGGFAGPQQQAQYGRALDTAKVASPVQVAQTQAKGNLDVQNAANAGFLEQLKQMGPLQPGDTVQGRGGMRVSVAPVSQGAATVGAKTEQQLRAELARLQNPSITDLGTNLFHTDAWRKNRIAEIQQQLGMAQAQQGRTPSVAAPNSSMRYVQPGTKDTINGVPAVWDGHNWVSVD